MVHRQFDKYTLGKMSIDEYFANIRENNVTFQEIAPKINGHRNLWYEIISFISWLPAHRLNYERKNMITRTESGQIK